MTDRAAGGRARRTPAHLTVARWCGRAPRPPKRPFTPLDGGATYTLAKKTTSSPAVRVPIQPVSMSD